MDEREFLQTLQERVREQEQAMNTLPFPRVFVFVSMWLSSHPWRFLIPLAFFVSLFLRLSMGQEYTNFVLWVFSRV